MWCLWAVYTYFIWDLHDILVWAVCSLCAVKMWSVCNPCNVYMRSTWTPCEIETKSNWCSCDVHVIFSRFTWCQYEVYMNSVWGLPGVDTTSWGPCAICVASISSQIVSVWSRFEVYGLCDVYVKSMWCLCEVVFVYMTSILNLREVHTR